MKTLTMNLDDESGRKSALREVSRQFSRNGAQVVASSVDQKLSRRAGITFRNLSLTFADNQKITMGVKTTGDVFEVRLNGKVLPLRNQDDHARAIAEIAERMDASRGAFQRALAKVRAPLPPAVKVSRSTMLQALMSKRDALREAITEGKAILASLTTTPAAAA